MTRRLPVIAAFLFLFFMPAEIKGTFGGFIWV